MGAAKTPGGWLQGFIGFTADSIALLFSYPFLIHSVRKQAATSTALTTTMTTSHSFEDPISSYCNKCSYYYYNGFPLVFAARSMNSWLFWAVYQYLVPQLWYPHSLLQYRMGFVLLLAPGWHLVAVVKNPVWVTVTRLYVHGETPKIFDGMWSGLHLNPSLVAYPSIRRKFVLQTLADFVTMTSLGDLSGRVLQRVFVWTTSYCGNNDCDSNKYSHCKR